MKKYEKRALEGLQPERVFYYFEELTRIPHGSYNVDQISDYIADFGHSHGFETYQDEYKNVIIIKEASDGYENEPPIILQGHMDMVAVHKPELDIDMKTEGLQVAINVESSDSDEHYIYAEGTSLGGDDGIAIAYAMAILEDDSLNHPRLEVVITTNEEVGMEGAVGVDLSMLKGNRLLNLDSEEEGIFLTSCAGGLRGNFEFDIAPIMASGTLFEIEIGGLLGGHSGEEIDKGRANSNKLAARLIYEIQKDLSDVLYITHFNGGVADNAIPRSTSLGIITSSPDIIKKSINIFSQNVSLEYATTDPDFVCNIISETNVDSIQAYNLKRAVDFIVAAPNGVISMSADVKGLVETSLNLGIVDFPVTSANEANYKNKNASASCENDCQNQSTKLCATFSIRSSIESAKEALTDRLIILANLSGATYTLTGNYPGWKYRANSPLRNKMVTLYEKMYGATPKLEAIHAGLECGILGSKINDLDCVSIGPDMKNIHTTEEKLFINSTRRVYEYVVALLALKD